VSSQGVSRLSTSALANELVKAIDGLYQPGFFQPDDFADLAERLV
jgi:hypothetical protein